MKNFSRNWLLLSFAFLVVTFISVNSCFSQSSDPLVGTFSSGILTFNLQGGNGTYSGQGSTQGQSYPLFIQCQDGKTIQGYYTDNGYNYPINGTVQGNTLNLTIIDLCAKGYFNYSDRSETIINAGDLAGGYQHSNQSGAGTWTVVSKGTQPVLKLTFHNGKTYKFVLSDRDGKTYLDDNRYFRTYSDSPVEDGRPECW